MNANFHSRVVGHQLNPRSGKPVSIKELEVA